VLPPPVLDVEPLGLDGVVVGLVLPLPKLLALDGGLGENELVLGGTLAENPP
jgi:hypothetical protein